MCDKYLATHRAKENEFENLRKKQTFGKTQTSVYDPINAFLPFEKLVKNVRRCPTTLEYLITVHFLL